MFNTLTDEQLSIQRNCAAIATVPSMRMRVIARAGTGKTTTMEAVVMKIKEEVGPQPLICYTAFNKTTETEFGERIRKKILAYKLPHKDIESRTLHSLCYSWFIGTRGGEFLRDMKDSIETEPVVKYFQLEKLIGERYGASTANVYTPVSTTTAGRGGLNRSKQQRVKYEAIMLGEMILKTLENFLNSAALEISDKHLPYQITNRFKEWTDKMDDYLKKHNCLKITAAEFYGKFDFINRAAALYKESLSHNEAVGMNVTHSVYQKYTQLSGAVLTSRQGRMFNVFLIDEAQDLNECQCAIIHRQYQQGSTIALVGDPAQSIYQFRGACRQFERWEVDAEETLTMSFRFGREIARLCNIMLGMEKLWLHSLRESITPAAMPLSVKKEVKREDACMDMSQLYTQVNHSTQSTTSSTNNSATQSSSAPPQPIQALVRGLADVNDKWVPLNTVLEYPFTVICRTNNNTYFALLECIQESVRQTRQATIAATISDHEDELDSTETSGGAGTTNTRKRAWEETYTGPTNDNLFDLTTGNASKPPLFSQVATPYTHHTIPKHNNGTSTHNNSNSSSFVTPVFARTGGLLGTNNHHTDSGNSGAPYHPTTPYDALTPMNPNTQPGSVQVLPNPPTANINTTRRFYVNRIKSYAQLENNLVRRIEQLAQMSQQKPFLYKGEHYTDIEALREVSTEMEDITLRELIDITKKWGSDLENIKNLIRTHYASTPAEADVFVTTVHKSKGLEWDRVALGIDIGAPLQAQPLFVIAFKDNTKSSTSSTPPSSGSSASSGAEVNDSSEFTHFAVCLEKTREAAFAAINFWLQVGQPARTAEAAPVQIGNEEVGNNNGGNSNDGNKAGGVYVKAEPGLTALKKKQSQNTGVKTNSKCGDIIDLCDDEEEGGKGEEWMCSRCASTNPALEKTCDTCFASRYPTNNSVAKASHNPGTNSSTNASTSTSGAKVAKVNPFIADRYAERTLSDFNDNYNMALGEPQGALLHAAGANGGVFKPSRDCNLVPLLPSTVALGYQMLRAPLGNDTNNGGNGGTANRYSKCQLLCLNTTHLPCRARVVCMFQHEVAERKRQFGKKHACVITKNGDGPQNYKLDFNDTVSMDETEAHTMREFNRSGGKVPQTGPSTVYGQGNHYIAQHHTQGSTQGNLNTGSTQGYTTQATQAAVATQSQAPTIKAEPNNTPAAVPRFDPFAIKFSNRQNANEWYVAVSRAKRTLRVNEELAQILEWIERDIGGLRTALKIVIGEEADVIVRK